MIASHLNTADTATQRIEKPLSNLVSDIIIPPPLATLILDSQPGEPWIPAIEDFERRLVTSRARTRVKAARDLGDVMEGLKIAVRVHRHLSSHNS